MNHSNILSMLDSTLLKQTATKREIRDLCEQGMHYGFAAVCVQPTFVSLAKEILAGSAVKVCTVAGFPMGVNISAVKAFEAEKACLQGAQEIDIVQNLGAVMEEDYAFVEADVRAVKQAIGNNTLKVILETCYLTNEQIVLSAKAALAGGADYIKTSTGLFLAGATEEHVALMRQTVGPDCGVKAAGGIRTLADCIRMKNAGASRIGTGTALQIAREACSGGPAAEPGGY